MCTACAPASLANNQEESKEHKRIILYPGNLSLVNKFGSTELEQGENTVNIGGLPAHSLESSSLFLYIDARVLSQNYREEKYGMHHIYRQLEGEDVHLISDAGREIKGTLISYRNGVARVETDDETWVTISNLHQYQLITEAGKAEHEDLPAITWNVDAEEDGDYSYTLRYIMQGLSWQPQYELRVDEDEEQMDFSFTANLRNTADYEFTNSELVFMAGDIQLQPGRVASPQRDYADEVMQLSGAVNVTREQAFEYYRYVLSGRHTIKQQEHHRFKLEEAHGLDAHKRYRSRLSGFGSQRSETQHFETGFVLQNTEDYGLGMLLPAGRVSVYQQYGDGDQLIGQDQLRQKAVGEEVYVQTGRSSDITWSERQISRDQRPDERVITEEREVTLTNRTDSEVQIELELSLGTNDSIEETSMNYEQLSARNVLFTVSIPADSEITENLKLKREDRRR